jgi:uncharacterized protein involved in outer membrane biogenesis
MATNSFKRWLLISFGAALLLVAALSALAWALVDAELIRAEMSAALGREVRFSEISPDLFAIKIDRLIVGDTVGFDPDPLLECESISLRYSIFSVLTGKLLIHLVALEKPVIRIEVDTAGRSNVADLLAPRPEGSLFDLENLEVRQGRVGLNGLAAPLAIDGLDLAISNLSSAPYVVRSSFAFLAAPVTLIGTVDPATLATRMRVTTSGFPLDSAPVPASIMNPADLTLELDAEIEYMGDSGAFEGKGRIPGLASIAGKIAAAWPDPSAPTGRGELSITANADGLRRIAPLRAKLDELQAAGDLRVTVRIDGPLDALPSSIEGELLGFSVKPPGFASRLENLRGGFALSPSRLVLKGMNLEAAGSPLTVSGSIGLAKTELDLAVASPRADLKALAGLIEPSPLPAGLALAGPARLDLKLKGTPPNVDATGTVELLGARLNLADPKTELTAINGAVMLAGNEIRLQNLSCRLGGSSLAASGTIDRAKETLDVTLKADRMTLADLPVALGSDRLKLDGTASFDGRISGRMAAPTVVGRIAADRASIFEVPVTGIVAHLDYRGDKVALSDVKASALEGAVSGGAAVTLAGDRLPFSINLDLGGLSLPTTLQSIGAGNALAGGVAQGRLTLSGDGKNLATYNGSGLINAEGIAIPALPLLKTLGAVLGVPTSSLENFNGGSAAFTISGGKLILTRTFALTNEHVDLRFGGALGLDGSIDGLTMTAGLRDGILPAAIGGIPLAAVLDLKKEGGRTYIPLKVRGTLMTPSLAPDIKPANVATNLLRDRLGIDLGPITGGAPRAPASSEGTPGDPKKDTAAPEVAPPPSTPRDEAAGIIRDLFNRRRRE